MIVALGMGVAAIVAGAIALQQRQATLAAEAALAKARVELDAARVQAQAALEEQRQRANTLLSEQEQRANTALETLRDDFLEAAQARDAAHTALERARAQISSLRRGMLEVGAERDALTRSLEETRQAQAQVEPRAADLAALRAKLELAEGEVARLRREDGRGNSRAVVSRMAELERRSEALERELELWRGRARAGEQELARRAGEAQDGEAARERQALQARVSALEEEARGVALARASLAVLGVPSAPRDADIFALERRTPTEAVLRDTYIAAAAAAALLADPRGAAWGRCGNAAVLERLAATVSLLSSADATAALGRPVQIISELYGVYGRHLITLPGSPCSLALTGSRETPALALRLAALRLAGVSETHIEAVSAPTLPLEPALSGRLDSWAARRGAQAVAVFGPGEPAGTDSVFAGAAMPLVKTVQDLFNRALRDGFAQGFSVIWRAADDECLCARVLDDGISVAFARFSAPPAARVLDDLAATLRWAPSPLAAAS